MSCDLVIGGQFGSEGKGSVVSWLSQQQDYDVVIRTGGHQAGHTMSFNGKIYKMRLIPCAWTSQAQLVIGEGAVVDEDVLCREIQMVSDALGISPKRLPLFISPKATLSTIEDRETEEKLKLQEKIGGTLEGVGAARASRCLRKAKTMADSTKCAYWVRECDTLNNPLAEILIESSQGFGLSLHSNYYPFCTSADINPYAILAEAGIPFGLFQVRVLGVIRTFPIRVGGNSGHFLFETSWAELREVFGKQIPEAELTTVTNRVRRVAYPNWNDIRAFNQRCHPNQVFLTFVDYIRPELHDKEGEIRADEVSKIPLLNTYFTLCPNIAYLGTGIGHFLKITGR